MRRHVSAALAVAAAAALLSSCGGGGDGDATATTIPAAGSTAFRTIPTTASTLSVVTVAGVGANSEVVYEVLPNDYYGKIVSQYGCESWEQIANYNEFEADKMLFPGDTVKIPAVCGATATATETETAAATEGASATEGATESATTTTVSADSDATYTVGAGDTVYGIATKFDVSPTALAEANGWSDGIEHLITPGDKIIIPS